jgi:hypothetical protein
MAPYLALRETPHGQMMIALPKRSPISKLPSPLTCRTMKLAKVGLIDVYQSICIAI